MSRQVRASAPDPSQWAAMQDTAATGMLPPMLPLKQAELAPTLAIAAGHPLASPKDAAKAQPLALMTERQQLAFLMRATSEGDEATAAGSARRKKQQQDMDDDDDEEESSDDEDDAPLQQDDTGAAAMSDESENEQAASASGESSSDSSEDDDEPIVPAAAVATTSAAPKASRAPANTDHLPQPVRRPLEYALWDSARRKAWDGMRTDPNKFYYNYLPPGVTAPASGSGGEAPWTPREKSLFMYSLEGYPPEGQWGLFSLNIPGRTGRECEAFFKTLHKEGLVSGGGVATAASARKPPANQPVKFSTAAALEYKLETTPIVVARALPLPGLASGASSAREHKEKRARELETAIALLSLLPMPGTVGLKAYVGREATSAAKTPATPQPAQKKKQSSQQAQASGEERSVEENKENRGGQQRSRARVTPSTPAAGATPNAAKATSSHRHASGSGAATVDKAGRNWPASATDSNAAGSDHKQQQRVRAASDALMACMSDIAASTSASRSAAASSSASISQELATAEDLAAPAVGSKRKPGSASTEADESAAASEARVPRKRAFTDAASAGGSGSGSGAGRSGTGSGSGGSGSRASRELRELLGSSPAITPLYPSHLVGRRVISTAIPQTVPAAAAVDASVAVPTETRVSSTPILPFSSFSIPAHTPYSGYSRRSALAHSDSLLRARRMQQPEAAALTPFAPAFFDPFRSTQLPQEEVPHIDNNTGNLTMRDATTGENTCAAAFAGAAAGQSGSATEDDDCDASTGSFAAELTKLDASYRLRLKRLASHQAQQLARIKRHYGVAEDSAAASVLAGSSHPNQNTRAAATGLPESGPFGASTHSFAKGCRRTLEEFFNKEMEQEAVPSVVSRCRTYGEAVHEINVSNKAVLKELQREHATGRDVLLSLKTTGLLR